MHRMGDLTAFSWTEVRTEGWLQGFSKEVRTWRVRNGVASPPEPAQHRGKYGTRSPGTNPRANRRKEPACEPSLEPPVNHRKMVWMRVARRFVVSGRATGVGFRYFTQDAARREGLTGVVRNLPDGRVEAVAEGDDSGDAPGGIPSTPGGGARVANYGAVRPPAVRVDDVEVDAVPVSGTHIGFPRASRWSI